MHRLRVVGEWVVLLPLWRRLIQSKTGQVAAAVVTAAVWVIIFVVAVSSGGSSEDDRGEQVAATATETAAATETASAEPTAALTAPPTAAPTPEPAGIGDGIHAIGTDTPPGTYRTEGTDFCYYARLSGFGGSLDEIIANNNGTGQQIVTIAATDVGFESSDCGRWIPDTGAGRADANAPFGDGIYFVGREVAAGNWRSEGQGCYWARLSGFGGTLDEIIANDVTDGQTIVTLDGSEAGFESTGCGEWTKV